MRTGADLVKDLEMMNEESVRDDFLKGRYKIPSYEIVREWLAAKDASRAAERDEESLSISRKALSISRDARVEARRANKLAISAIIIAVIGIALPFVIGWLKR